MTTPNQQLYPTILFQNFINDVLSTIGPHSLLSLCQTCLVASTTYNTLLSGWRLVWSIVWLHVQCSPQTHSVSLQTCYYQHQHTTETISFQRMDFLHQLLFGSEVPDTNTFPTDPPILTPAPTDPPILTIDYRQ